MPEPELRELALGVLRGLFGALPEPLEITRTAWNTDPFSRGAYSYLAVGATPDDIDELAEPVDDVLFFAGEATHRHHWACLHGAYVSGLREAARITGDDAILPSRHFVENRRWREMLQRADRFFNLAVRSVDRREVEARLNALRRIALFERVPSEDLRVLATMVDTQDFVDGELICRAGEPATRMYAVASGQVLVILPGATAPVATMAPGDVVGEYGMFGTEERTATLVARGPTRVLSLDYPRFRYFLLAFPEAMLSLMSLTVSRLKEAQKPRAESA
jgi:hypothetical protein